MTKYLVQTLMTKETGLSSPNLGGLDANFTPRDLDGGSPLGTGGEHIEAALTLAILPPA